MIGSQDSPISAAKTTFKGWFPFYAVCRLRSVKMMSSIPRFGAYKAI